MSNRIGNLEKVTRLETHLNETSKPPKHGTGGQTMYDELVKRLRTCPDYNDGCTKCPHEHDLGCRSTTMREAADAIEELQATLCNWCAICPEDKRDFSTCEIYESCRAKPQKEE